MKNLISLIIGCIMGVLFLWCLGGCETSVDAQYQTRWFYEDESDVWKSRASGATMSRGFTAFNKGDDDAESNK